VVLLFTSNSDCWRMMESNHDATSEHPHRLHDTGRQPRRRYWPNEAIRVDRRRRPRCSEGWTPDPYHGRKPPRLFVGTAKGRRASLMQSRSIETKTASSRHRNQRLNRCLCGTYTGRVLVQDSERAGQFQASRAAYQRTAALFISHRLPTAYGHALTSEPRALAIPSDPAEAWAFAVRVDRAADHALSEGRFAAAERLSHQALEARCRATGVRA
jgi:hypothetical protein